MNDSDIVLSGIKVSSEDEGPTGVFTRSPSMSSKEDLELLVVTIRQFIGRAQRENDCFEYFRLWEELRFAESALKSLLKGQMQTRSIASSSNLAFI